jgi:hypothetical protein
MLLELSQIIYAVRNLDAGAQRIAAYGLIVLDGGRHPGLGTANRIVPLGGSYFELLSVVDEREARGNNFGRALLAQLQQGDHLVRWSLRTDDIDRVAAERGLKPERRSRRRPDDVLLSWRAAGLDLSLREGWLPFFMQWDDPAQYPGSLPVQHAQHVHGIAWLEITPRDDQLLQRWLGSAHVPLRIVADNPGIHHVGLSVENDVLVLP